jgi:hypothetical protein
MHPKSCFVKRRSQPIKKMSLSQLMDIGGPVIAAALWATFAVPDDPSRSGKAPVPIPEAMRPVLELSLFGFAAWALCDAASQMLALIMASYTIIHYALSYDRVAWLLSREGTKNS